MFKQEKALTFYKIKLLSKPSGTVGNKLML